MSPGNSSGAAEAESFESVCLDLLNSINEAKERLHAVETVFRNKVCSKFQEEMNRMRHAITLEEKSHEQSILDWGVRRQSLISEIDNLKKQFEIERGRFVEEFRVLKSEKVRLHEELNAIRNEVSTERESMQLIHKQELKSIRDEAKTRCEILRLELTKERNALQKSIEQGKELRSAYIRLKEKYCAEDECSYLNLGMSDVGVKRSHSSEVEMEETMSKRVLKFKKPRSNANVATHPVSSSDLTSNGKSSGKDVTTKTFEANQSILVVEKDTVGLKLDRKDIDSKSGSTCSVLYEWIDHCKTSTAKKSVSCDLNSRFKLKEKEKEKKGSLVSNEYVGLIAQEKGDAVIKQKKSIATKKGNDKWRSTRCIRKEKPNEEDSHDDFLESPRMEILNSLSRKRNMTIDHPTKVGELSTSRFDSEDTVMLNSSQECKKVESSDEDDCKNKWADKDAIKDDQLNAKPDIPPKLTSNHPTNTATDNVSAPKFKYNAVVRRKADRENLKAGDCTMCQKFYEAVLAEDAQGIMMSKCEHHQLASRHRYNFVPPSTPQGFWNIGFDSD